ncbi:MAG TPA: tripartite tricarboxylate transporter substrate binding protein [Ramlibacter sp.]|nr:tripartite tricarboxylate transporter substrate binding protein [Ramlibacter sp.]
MRNVIRRVVVCAVALACAGLGLNTAQAQESKYPRKPVTVVVPYTAGGVVDAATRTVIDAVASRYGVTVIVENKTGADGMIAAQHVKRANADGYTLLAVAPFIVTTPMLRPNASFQTSDFTPVGMLAVGPNLIVTPLATPANSLQEFIDYARKRPGQFNAAISARGGSMHLGTEVFMDVVGVRMLTVPFKGAPDSVTGLVRGDIQFGILPASVAAPLVTSGKLKALAVASPVRLPALPDVPTMIEAGAPKEAVVTTWYGLMARAGTPPSVVTWWNTKINEALKSPQVIEKLQLQSLIAAPYTVPAFGKLLVEEQATWKTMVKKLSLTAE